MKLYLLRHGHRGNGVNQDSLTSIGEEQAKRTAAHFERINIDKVICADNNRARETANDIIKLKKCLVEYTSEVNEQSLGTLQGKSGEEYRKALKESESDENGFRPFGGESRLDAYARAERFFEKLKKEDSQTILIVSHAGFISDLITLILDIPMSESVHFKTQFCSISYFDLDINFKPKNLFINDITHLAEESPYLKKGGTETFK